MSAVSTCPVPAMVTVGDERVRVERAWPSTRVTGDGGRVIRLEGRDELGRLRAGRLAVPEGRSDAGSGATVTLMAPGHDRKLPDLAGALAGGGELVVHRLGRRAVVRHDDRYVKVLRPGAAGAAVVQRSRDGGALVTAAGMTAPEVLDADGSRVDLSILRGSALHDAGASMDPAQWRTAWQVWAGAWVAFAQQHTAGINLPTHTADGEVSGLRGWLEHTRRFTSLPHLELTLSRRVAEVADALAAGPADPLLLSHRDLHDKQVFWDGEAIGLLDLDTMARAEAACDLGNLAVHAELRAVQGLWSDTHRDIVLEHVALVADELSVSERRLGAYAEATRLRLTMLYAFRPRWAAQMGDWLHERTLIALSSS